jgi:hypothetical protein
LGKEESLAERKSVLEEKALKLLQNDLQDQILTIQLNNEKMGGRVTPLSMEQLLSNRLKMTIDEFERFIEQSELDLGDEEDELAQLTQVLLKE